MAGWVVGDSRIANLVSTTAAVNTIQNAAGPFSHQICSKSRNGVLRATGNNNIIMVTLWVLNVKCKAQGITKEAILCKYSRQ